MAAMWRTARLMICFQARLPQRSNVGGSRPVRVPAAKQMLDVMMVHGKHHTSLLKTPPPTEGIHLVLEEGRLLHGIGKPDCAARVADCGVMLRQAHQ
jgi:hypothetical protein